MRLNFLGNALRWLVGIGVFIILAAYSGNLTSFLSIPIKTKPINSVEDLLNHKDTIPSVAAGNNLQRYIEVKDMKSF